MRCAAAAAARPATTVTRTDSDGGGAAEAAAQLCLHTCLAAAFSAELGHRRKASYYAREAARVRRMLRCRRRASASALRRLRAVLLLR